MKEIYLVNEDFKEVRKALKEAIEDGAKYIVYATDNFLSGWGGAVNRKHKQFYIAYTYEQKEAIKRFMDSDSAFKNKNYDILNENNINNIINKMRKYSYCLRNDLNIKEGV